MASNNENITLKVNVDSQGSMTTLKQLEDNLTSLKGKIKEVGVGSQEFKSLQSQIISTEATVKNLNKSFEGLDKEQLAGEFGKLAGGITAGFGAISAIAGKASGDVEALIATVAQSMAIVQGIKGATEAWTASQKLLNLAMTANPIGLIITAVGVLVGAIVALIANGDKVINMLDGWAKKVSFLRGPIELIKAGIEGLMNAWEQAKRLILGDEAVDAQIQERIDKMRKESKERQAKRDSEARQKYIKDKEEEAKKEEEIADKKKQIYEKQVAAAEKAYKDGLDKVTKVKQQEIAMLEAQGGKEEEIYNKKRKLITDQIEYAKNAGKIGEEDYNNYLVQLAALDKQHQDYVTDTHYTTTEKILNDLQARNDGSREMAEQIYEAEVADLESKIETLEEGTKAYEDAVNAKVAKEMEWREIQQGWREEDIERQEEEDEAEQEKRDALDEYREAQIENMDDDYEREQARLDFEKQKYQEEINMLSSYGVMTEEQTARYNTLMEKQMAIDKKKSKLRQQLQTEDLQKTAQVLDMAQGLFNEDTVAFKAIAIAKALINTYLGVTAGLAEGGIIGIAMAAITLASGLASVATIAGIQFEKGGVLGGPSHAQGGILTPYGELEGGEGVISLASMTNPSLRNMASAANVAGGGNDFSVGDGSVTLSTTSLDYLANTINDKKVYVTESDITETQNRVKVYETNSTI